MIAKINSNTESKPRILSTSVNNKSQEVSRTTTSIKPSIRSQVDKNESQVIKTDKTTKSSQVLVTDSQEDKNQFSILHLKSRLKQVPGKNSMFLPSKFRVLLQQKMIAINLIAQT